MNDILAFFEVPTGNVAIMVPLIVFGSGAAIAICALIFQHRRRELWHQTARIALEKGQPLPPEFDTIDKKSEPSPFPPARATRVAKDIRSGLILIAVGAGLYLGNESRTGAYICGFIGAALLLYGVLGLALSKPTDKP